MLQPTNNHLKNHKQIGHTPQNEIPNVTQGGYPSTKNDLRSKTQGTEGIVENKGDLREVRVMIYILGGGGGGEESMTGKICYPKKTTVLE